VIQTISDISELPENLVALVSQRGESIKSAALISTLPDDREDRVRTFRIECENGLVMKGRTSVSRRLGRRVRSILRRLPQYHFSQILEIEDNCLLEEWVEGTTLDRQSTSTHLIKECGRLLGVIHTTVADARSFGRLSTDRYQNWIKASLLHLILRDCLDRYRTEYLLNEIINRLPEYTDYGITHRDFGPDNLVRRNGKLISIDNMLMNYQAYHEDLARAWYGWGCSDDQFQLFLEGYSEHRSASLFLEEQGFWKAYVLLKAADFRSKLDDSSTARDLLNQIDLLL